MIYILKAEARDQGSFLMAQRWSDLRYQRTTASRKARTAELAEVHSSPYVTLAQASDSK